MAVTHQNVLDPVVALLVGLNILVTGWRLLHGSLEGLMDVTLSEEQNAALIAALEAHSCAQVRFHGLQTRAAGQASFANVHMLIPGSWSVRHGHEFAHEIAEAMEAAVPGRRAPRTVGGSALLRGHPRRFALGRRRRHVRHVTGPAHRPGSLPRSAPSLPLPLSEPKEAP